MSDPPSPARQALPGIGHKGKSQKELHNSRRRRMTLNRRGNIALLGVVVALFATLTASVRAEICADFRGQIALLESLKESSTSHPDYINAAKMLATTTKSAMESQAKYLRGSRSGGNFGFQEISGFRYRESRCLR